VLGELRKQLGVELPMGGFRGGGKEAMPPKMPKSSFFALHMQCVINLCSKTNQIYTQYMHF